MLAGVKTMLCHRDILQGVQFQWFTDHKRLIHLLEQQNLLGRQACWMEKIVEFNFQVIYILGVENILSDALSRLYSNNQPGTVRSRSEYTYFNVVNNNLLGQQLVTMLVLMGLEGRSIYLTEQREIATGDHAQGKRAYQRRGVELAETRQSETLREFALRMASHFVLKGLGKQNEGVKQAKPDNSTLDIIPDHQSKEQDRKRLIIRLPARKKLLLPNDGSTESDDKAWQERYKDEALSEKSRRLEDLIPLTLEELLKMGMDPIDLISACKGQYKEDKLFKEIIERLKEYKNFEITEDRVIYLKSEGKKLLCISTIIIWGWSAQEIVISEAHSLLARLEPRKTLLYLHDHVWWKTMAHDVQEYCNTCNQNKYSNQKPYGLLQPLKVPTSP